MPSKLFRTNILYKEDGIYFFGNSGRLYGPYEPNPPQDKDLK